MCGLQSFVIGFEVSYQKAGLIITWGPKHRFVDLMPLPHGRQAISAKGLITTWGPKHRFVNLRPLPHGRQAISAVGLIITWSPKHHFVDLRPLPHGRQAISAAGLIITWGPKHHFVDLRPFPLQVRVRSSLYVAMSEPASPRHQTSGSKPAPYNTTLVNQHEGNSSL